MAAKPGVTLDDVSCSICGDIYESPLALPCVHGFCRKCLEALAAPRMEDSLAPPLNVVCPICRRVANIPEGGVRKFPVHFFIAQKIQEYNERITSSNAAVNCDDTTQNFCSKHKAMKAFYCDDCNETKCPACILHVCQKQDHQYGTQEAKYQEYLTVVTTVKEGIADRQASVKEFIDRTVAVQEDVQGQKDSALDRMHQFFENTHKMLTDMEMLYTNQINSLSASHRDACLQAKQPKEKLLNDITRQLNDIDEVIRSSSVEEFLTQKRVNVMARLQEMAIDGADDLSVLPQTALICFLPLKSLLEILFPSSIGKLATIDDLPKASFAGEPKLNQINYVFYQSANTAVPGGLDVSMTLTGQEVNSTQKDVDSTKIPLVQVNAERQYLIAYVPSIRGRCKLEFSENDGSEGNLKTHFVAYTSVLPSDLKKPVCFYVAKSKVVATAPAAAGSQSELPLRVCTESGGGILAYSNGKFRAISSFSFREFWNRSPASGLVITDTGAIYQSITDRNTILQFSPTCGLVRCLPSCSSTLLNGPTGLAVCENILFVCDTNNHCIRLFDLELNHRGTIADQEEEPEGQLVDCIDIAVDHLNMKIYIVDSGTNGVHIRHINGRFIQCIRGLSEPRGVCINEDYLYVTELGASRISVFTLDGGLVNRIGEGHLQSPYGIDVDQDGFVWVCDWGKEKIFVF